MSIPFIGDLIREIGVTAREFIPDPDKRAEIELKMAELADQADARENELLAGQIEVNKIEAQSSNIFVSGWRPAIGWVGASALAYTWILAPLSKALFHLSTLPAVPTDEIYPLILALLGVGAMRTVEKMRGVATTAPGTVLPPLKAITPTKSRWFR